MTAAEKSAGMDLGGSRYESIAESIERDRHVSQGNAMPAEEFARKLADLLTRRTPPAVVRRGADSFLLPDTWLDAFLSRRFGLSGVKR